MSKRIRTICIALFVIVSASLPVYSGVVTTTTDATELTHAIIGSGVTLVGTPTLVTANLNQQGIFTNAFNEIGFVNGIVLSTGEIDGAKIFAPNSSPIETYGAGDGTPDVDYALGSSGFPELNALTGEDTFDGNALTFQFSLEEDATLFFNFVFASEEYIDYVDGGYNDSFAFFLNGQNVALVEGVPVGVDTINPYTNNQYYVNNVENADGFPVAGRNIRFDGMTVVLRVEQPLSAGIHEIRIMIADTGDPSYDSAVFIQAGTFSTTPTPTEIPEPASAFLIAFAFAGVFAAKVLKTRSVSTRYV